MFKNMLKRSWLSTIRKPSRTIILVLILFVMANLMLATIAIKGAVNKSMDYAKDSLGGTVYLQADMTALREKMSQQITEPTDSTSTSTGFIKMERPTVDVETATKIADSKYIKDFTYSISATANASGFSAVETEENQQFSEMRAMINQNGDQTEQLSFGDITIEGINSFAFISGVESGDISLSSGEIFDETTDNSVMISYDLADQNNIKVGDTIALKTIESESEISLKVIGIYETSSDGFNLNTVYMNPDTAASFLDSSEITDGNYNVNSVKYYLTNAEYKDAFIAEAKAKYPNLESDGLKLDIDDTAYQQMVGPIESVGSFATTILWIVVAASIVIITLMVTINVKDRRYEMGVLLSLGAKKINILGQIFTELVVVGTVAFILSIGTSTFIASALGDSLLEQQISMNQQQQQQTFGRGNGAGSPSLSSGVMIGRLGQNTSDVEQIDEINVNATAGDYAVLFGAGYAIIILALILPATNILRYQPKTILTGKE